MHRKFIALVLSAALAVTGMTAPTTARADDTAEWVAGIAALAIIGLAISENNRKKKHYHNQPTYHTHKPKHHKPKVHHRKALPAGCVVTERLQGHKIKGLSKRCLKRHYSHAHNLPRGCLIKVQDPYTHERRTFYGGRCLRQHGYTLARGY